MITNADITVFNKVLGTDRRDVYVPTYFYGVSWYGAHNGSLQNKALSGGSRYVVRIPITATVSGNKQYILADDFDDLPDNEKSSYWTIQTGCVVAKGIVQLEAGVESLDENEVMMLPNEQFNVTTYADNTIRGTAKTKHWRLGGF